MKSKGSKILFMVLCMTAITGTTMLKMNALPTDEYEDYGETEGDNYIIGDDESFYEDYDYAEDGLILEPEKKYITEHLYEPDPSWFEEAKESIKNEAGKEKVFTKTKELENITFESSGFLVCRNTKHPYGLYRYEVSLSEELKAGTEIEIKVPGKCKVWNVSRKDSRMDECLSEGFDIEGYKENKSGFTYILQEEKENTGIYFYIEPEEDIGDIELSISVKDDKGSCACTDYLKASNSKKYNLSNTKWEEKENRTLFLNYENMGETSEGKLIRCRINLEDVQNGGVVSICFPNGMNGIETTGVVYEDNDSSYSVKGEKNEDASGFYFPIDGIEGENDRVLYFDIAVTKGGSLSIPIYAVYETEDSREIALQEISFSKGQADVSLSIGKYEKGMKEVPFVLNVVPLDMNCGGMFLELATPYYLWEEAEEQMADSKYKMSKERIMTGERFYIEDSIPVENMEESADIEVRAYVEGWADSLTFKKSTSIDEDVKETNERFIIHY